MKNIYIIGRCKGNYRTQNLIKFLLDQHYSVCFNSLEGSWSKSSPGYNKALVKVLNKTQNLVSNLFKTYFIAKADLVILPAQCNEYQRELSIAKRFKKKIITDYYISFYDSRVLDRKTYKPDSSKAREMLEFDRNCISKSDLVLFLNSTEARRYLDLVHLEFDKEKHKIVPLVVEEKADCKLPYYRQESKESHVLIICWWGAYIPLHGLEKILEAAQILKEAGNLDFHFYLFGSDQKKSLPYREMVEGLNISDRVSIENSYTFSNGKLGPFLEENCDLVLGNFGDSEKAKNVLVNKLIDGVAMGAPVLTGESVAPHEFFSEQEIFYSKNAPDQIADKILEISRETPAEIQQRVTRAKAIYRNNFSVEAFEKKISALL